MHPRTRLVYFYLLRVIFWSKHRRLVDVITCVYHGSCCCRFVIFLFSFVLIHSSFFDPYNISNAYIRKTNEWPCIRPGDGLALVRFSTFLVQCQSAMTSLPFLTILSHPHNMQSMAKKLPFPLQDRWRREASRWRVSRQTIPAFAEFVAFVKSEAGIATDPVFSRDALSRVMEPARTYTDKRSQV